MTVIYPNLALPEQLDRRNMSASAHLFTEDTVFHNFNPNLPDLRGDHVGSEGIRAFFEALAEMSLAMFRIEPVSAVSVGKELVVIRSRNSLTFNGCTVTFDVVVVWRIVNGRIVEVWDIAPGQPTEVKYGTD